MDPHAVLERLPVARPDLHARLRPAHRLRLDPGRPHGRQLGQPDLLGTWPEDTVAAHLLLLRAAHGRRRHRRGERHRVLRGLRRESARGVPGLSGHQPAYQPIGTPGAALSGSNQFQIQNAAANPGTKSHHVAGLRVVDNILDGTDTLLATDSIGAARSLRHLGIIPYGGTWPAFGSDYRLILAGRRRRHEPRERRVGTRATIDVVRAGVHGRRGEQQQPRSNDQIPLAKRPCHTAPPDGSVPGTCGSMAPWTRRTSSTPTGCSSALKGTTRALPPASCGRREATRAISTSGTKPSAQGSAVSLDIDIEEVTFVGLTPRSRVLRRGVHARDHSGVPYQLYLYADP